MTREQREPFLECCRALGGSSLAFGFGRGDGGIDAAGLAIPLHAQLVGLVDQPLHVARQLLGPAFFWPGENRAEGLDLLGKAGRFHAVVENLSGNLLVALRIAFAQQGGRLHEHGLEGFGVVVDPFLGERALLLRGSAKLIVSLIQHGRLLLGRFSFLEAAGEGLGEFVDGAHSWKHFADAGQLVECALDLRHHGL